MMSENHLQINEILAGILGGNKTGTVLRNMTECEANSNECVPQDAIIENK